MEGSWGLPAEIDRLTVMSGDLESEILMSLAPGTEKAPGLGGLSVIAMDNGREDGERSRKIERGSREFLDYRELEQSLPTRGSAVAQSQKSHKTVPPFHANLQPTL